MTELQVSILQSNPTIGNISENCDDIIKAMEESKDSDILLTPELSLIGYPPMDILRRDKMYEVQREKLNLIKEKTRSTDLCVVVGYCRRTDRGLYNSAVVFKDGIKLKTYDKVLLPTYDVFDGHRYFETGNSTEVFELDGNTVGLSICEDAWYNVDIMDAKRHKFNPFDELKKDNPDVILNLSASPFRVNKNKERIQLFKQHANNADCSVVFCNQVGGNDELVFDGNSFVVDTNGDVEQLNQFETDLRTFDLSNVTDKQNKETEIKQVRSALTLGLEDYFKKTGFSKAIVGMSGGIDSTIATVIATEALGKHNVTGVTLPAEVTSKESIEDAKAVANNLGIDFKTIDISDIISNIKTNFESQSGEELKGLAYENIQARVRGNVLMTLSNRTNALVVTPDNKSESAIGYCTLYGDTVGAIAPLGDCYKVYVYKLAKLYNQEYNENIIPERIIDKKPTAELKPDQYDEKEMPDYAILDVILNQYVENRAKPTDFDIDIEQSKVNDIVRKIHAAEFKRNQSPLPIRVTKKDFGRGWRFPIAADYSFLEE